MLSFYILYEFHNILIHFTDNLKDLVPDYFVGPFITINPEFCMVAQNSNNTIVGFTCAALDINVITRKTDMCWIPAMREKYPHTLLNNSPTEPLATTKDLSEKFYAMIKTFHSFNYDCPTEVSTTYPATLMAFILDETYTSDHGLAKRLMTVSLATLRANGCFGVHVRLDQKARVENIEFYAKLGFTEVFRDPICEHLYLGRRF